MLVIAKPTNSPLSIEKAEVGIQIIIKVMTLHWPAARNRSFSITMQKNNGKNNKDHRTEIQRDVEGINLTLKPVIRPITSQERKVLPVLE